MPIRMGSEQKGTIPRFVCAKEASDLLNCIAANEYVEHKCLDRMKKLRKCTQKERVVSFNLLPDEDEPQTQPSQQISEKNRLTKKPEETDLKEKF